MSKLKAFLIVAGITVGAWAIASQYDWTPVPDPNGMIVDMVCKNRVAAINAVSFITVGADPNGVPGCTLETTTISKRGLANIEIFEGWDGHTWFVMDMSSHYAFVKGPNMETHETLDERYERQMEKFNEYIYGTTEGPSQ